MKEFIKLNKVIINNDQVIITSDHTCYANETRYKSLNVKHLLKRFTILSKALKDKGCSVSHKYESRKYIADNIEEYNQAVIDYNQHFESMVKLALKITSEPLPVGTSDNKDLNALYGHRNLCLSMLTRSSILSKVYEFELKILELEQAVTEEDFSYSKVTF